MEDVVSPDLSNFYKGKRVLVTGHTGFKGSWFSAWLGSLGAKVFGYALPPETRPALFEVLALNSTAEHCFSDVRDFGSLLAFTEKSRPEIVFHMAAQPLVGKSCREPRETYETNVLGTVNLLEALRLVGSAGVVVVVTTDKVYANKEWVWGYRETDPLGGRDPYSASKACAELVSRSYYESFFRDNRGICLSTARAGNVIGGGDWSEDRILPDCIAALSHGESIQVRNPSSIRPWQHVLEPLYGYLVLAALMSIRGDPLCGSWNFGPDTSDECTVKDLVEQVISEWGAGCWRSSEGSHALAETKVLKLDCERARTSLKWRPRMNHREAIHATVQWYAAYYSGVVDMKSFTLRQIGEYMEKISAGGSV